jgi:multiple sugar transport system ATP-binding protein
MSDAAGAARAAVLECRGLRKTYRSGPLDVPVLLGIDLAVAPGERLAIVGASGSGKSTLLHLLGGLDAPSAGEVLVQGAPFAQLSEAERGRVRNRALGFIYQFHHLLPEFSALENVAMPLLIRREHKHRANADAAAMLERVGLAPRALHRPGELSGGERQRVALARALVRDPAVFLLDEPLSNLDAQLRASARDELQQFQRRIGTTTIYVTHDQVEAMGLGDRIAVMRGGTVRQIGTPKDIYREPADTFVARFVGSPPMNLVQHQNYILGFRPEHFLPKGTQNGKSKLLTLPFHVTRVEYLGADRLLYGTLPGAFADQKVIARLPSTVTANVEPETTTDFTVEDRELKFFDNVTELRISSRPL